MDNERLLRVYKSIHGSNIPLPLQHFISSGGLATFPDTLFTYPATGQQFLIRFIKDMEYRMDGTADQNIRLSIAKTCKSQEPIGFAELTLQGNQDEFLYYLIVFPKLIEVNHVMKLDENDPTPIYLVKLKAQKSRYTCTTYLITENFDAFIAEFRNHTI